jgi:hypothetical protein
MFGRSIVSKKLKFPTSIMSLGSDCTVQDWDCARVCEWLEASGLKALTDTFRGETATGTHQNYTELHSY